MRRAVIAVTSVASNVSSEGIIATLPPTPLPEEPSGIVIAHYLIDGFVNFTAGAGTTAIVLRCRRTGLAGALVGPALTHTMAAGTSFSIAFSADDAGQQAQPPNEGQIYVVTVQQTGGTGAGTTNYAVLTVTTS